MTRKLLEKTGSVSLDITWAVFVYLSGLTKVAYVKELTPIPVLLAIPVKSCELIFGRHRLQKAKTWNPEVVNKTYTQHRLLCKQTFRPLQPREGDNLPGQKEKHY